MKRAKAGKQSINARHVTVHNRFGAAWLCITGRDIAWKNVEPKIIPFVFQDAEILSSAGRASTAGKAPQTLYTEPIQITHEVYSMIKNTVGTFRPETGMMLGTSDGQVIDHCYFDENAQVSGGEYNPNIDHLNDIVLPTWNSRGISMVGFVHSHPCGYCTPSPWDIQYAGELLSILPGLSKFVIPIVQSRATGQFSIQFYCVRRSLSNASFVEPCKHKIIFRNRTDEDDAVTNAMALRTGEVYPRDVMATKTVVVVGCGGSGEYVEYLARCGVGRIILIDGDKYERSNIETQKAYTDEIGVPKPFALATRVARIDPDIEVVAVPHNLDNDFEDDVFAALIGQDILTDRPKDVLIAGCTDDFYAQMRTARLALNLSCPYVATQIYARGDGAEVIFTYPGVTASCPRCMLGSRYDAYLEEGFVNDTTSAQAPLFCTQRANATVGFISSMLLLYGCAPTSRFNDELDKVKNRNFVLIRMRDSFDAPPFDGGFAESGYTYYDDTAWVMQVPDDGLDGRPRCPDCHGHGNLLALKGMCRDTRKL
ncbi:MAG: ThiF family adenylyltransferase [Coriobacteriales bacterium]|jgi:proteasome lid subunit RPN8/RPN11|nr:ThiF family adenylyltransferase [Coriobacteriales bacterium]